MMATGASSAGALPPAAAAAAAWSQGASTDSSAAPTAAPASAGAQPTGAAAQASSGAEQAQGSAQAPPEPFNAPRLALGPHPTLRGTIEALSVAIADPTVNQTTAQRLYEFQQQLFEMYKSSITVWTG